MPQAIRIPRDRRSRRPRAGKRCRAGDPARARRACAIPPIGVNYIDTYHRSGLYKLPLPAGIGAEGAGVVDGGRQRCDRCRAGRSRRAIAAGAAGQLRPSAYMPADRLIKLPEGVADRAGRDA